MSGPTITSPADGAMAATRNPVAALLGRYLFAVEYIQRLERRAAKAERDFERASLEVDLLTEELERER
jgi:hypothetical protein